MTAIGARFRTSEHCFGRLVEQRLCGDLSGQDLLACDDAPGFDCQATQDDACLGDALLALAPEHVSLYLLTVEPRTPLAAASGSALPIFDCSGTHDFAFTQAYMASKFLTAGDTIYVQYSGRDPFKAAPNNRNSSNAIRVTIAP